MVQADHFCAISGVACIGLARRDKVIRGFEAHRSKCIVMVPSSRIRPNFPKRCRIDSLQLAEQLLVSFGWVLVSPP